MAVGRRPGSASAGRGWFVQEQAGSTGPAGPGAVGGRHARSLWGSSLSVRVGARPAAECAEGEAGGRWERGCKAVAGREEGLGRRTDAVGPWHAVPLQLAARNVTGALAWLS